MHQGLKKPNKGKAARQQQGCLLGKKRPSEHCSDGRFSWNDGFQTGTDLQVR